MRIQFFLFTAIATWLLSTSVWSQSTPTPKPNVRKLLTEKTRLSFGTELDRTGFYLYNLNPASPKTTYEYRQIDLNNGLVFERLIASQFVFTARAGMRYSPSAKVFEKSESFDQSDYKMKIDPSFYAQIGISFNPFTSSKK